MRAKTVFIVAAVPAPFFAGFPICIMVGGSLWIMLDLHYRMIMQRADGRRAT